jgi:cullin-associated NEDD8-dissociated protein 1
VVEELAAAVPEFHATNLNRDQGPRPIKAEQEPHGRTYKAIVVVNLHGGADSFNFLVPHSNCGRASLYEEYSNARGNVAIPSSDLLQINVPAGTQPCETFGMNNKFVNTQQLYEQGDAAWVANVGTLVEPITAEEYKAGSKARPPSLFGHAQQRQQVQQIHSQNPNAKGVLGRAVGSLMGQALPYKSALYNVGGGEKIVTGAPQSPVAVHAERGVQTWARAGGDLQARYYNITQRISGSIFAETYTESVDSSLRTVEKLAQKLGNAQATTAFPNTGLGKQLKMVSRLTKVDLAEGTERGVFMTKVSGFDTHSSGENSKGPILPQLMAEFDDAVGAFVEEMKLQGIWDDVLVVSISDFGRTMAGNSAAGTDHGWGGNNIILGGGVNGSRVFGEYPSTLAPGEGQDIGHGRMLPTLAWEGVWSPILRWFGVDEADLHDVLPNLPNFSPNSVIPVDQLFKSTGGSSR